MLTIAFGFPAGRYHATAWDHHVNEGTVEWPPSPWRIARALVAASYKLWPIADDADVRSLLEPLLAPPSYRVPPAGDGHTRHYMPTDQAGKPVKVFDAFVAPAGELFVHWPEVELDAAQSRLLDRILEVLTYLGRAESWVEARRTERPAVLNCTPGAAGANSVSLHVPVPPADYAAWRDGFLAAQQHTPKKERRELPATWWDVLHVQTERLFREGWSSPPGVQRARYTWTPELVPRSRHSASASNWKPTMARFECASAVLPRLTDAISVGDRLREALMSRSDAHPVFSGKLRDGTLRTGHGHAYFAPSDDDADGRIDHLLVHAREGFDDVAVRALQQLRKLWGHGGHDVHVALIALGQPGDFGAVRHNAMRLGASALLGPREGACVWESHTPFVPPRHAKLRRGAALERPEDQVRALLGMLGVDPPVSVERMAAGALSLPRPPKPVEWHRFRIARRKGGGARGICRGFGFRLTFARPVHGPIAVGYGAHQGLGQFVAID